MIGPILRRDLLRGFRRGRLFWFGWIYAGWLLLVLTGLFVQKSIEQASPETMVPPVGAEANAAGRLVQVVASRFVEFFAWQQPLLVLLFVPVFTAGALIEEKRQGTLPLLLLSETTPRCIVLGKLFSRVVQMAIWLLAGVPLLVLMAWVAGIEPIILVLLALGQVPVLFGVAGLSLLASAWCRQTRDAVLLVYGTLLTGGLIVSLVGGMLRHLEPSWVLEPAWAAANGSPMSEAWLRLAGAAVSWGLIGGLAVSVCAWQLEPGYVREDRECWIPFDRGPIGDNPVRWREQVVEGLAIHDVFRRVPSWLAVLAIVGCSTVSSVWLLAGSLAPEAELLDIAEAVWSLNVRRLVSLMPQAHTAFLVQGLVVMLLASLVVGIRCAGAISQERERLTWEALLLTPISARQMVHGKLAGVLRASGWYLLAYAVPAICLSVLGGILALIYTICWLAVTVLAMYFLGATGLWYSLRSNRVWKSLGQTVLVGYLSALMVYTFTFPATALLALLLWLLLVALRTLLAVLPVGAIPSLGENLYWLVSIASAIGLILIFWLLARVFLHRTIRWIADRERGRLRLTASSSRRPRGRSAVEPLR